MSDPIYSVAIDGPAGAGKSTIAKKVANILNIEYIDTGAMYRAITLKVLNAKLDFSQVEKMEQLLDDTEVDFKNGKVYLDGLNVDKDIRENIISKNASQLAQVKLVRNKLLALQREIAENKSVLMDGRDIGSVVLPKADYKFFLTASIDERARRRYRELKENNPKVSYEEVREEIIYRDYMDSNREIAPLVRTSDAILVDSTNLTIEETVEAIVSEIEV